MRINTGSLSSGTPGDVPFPSELRPMITWAVQRARQIAQGNPPCNIHFSTLPGGRSLQALVNDDGIFLHFNPALAPSHGGTSKANPPTTMHTFDIAFSMRPFQEGRWKLLATLIHELAHVNGAPGGKSHQAERTLFHCGLANPQEAAGGRDDPSTAYNPGVTG